MDRIKLDNNFGEYSLNLKRCNKPTVQKLVNQMKSLYDFIRTMKNDEKDMEYDSIKAGAKYVGEQLKGLLDSIEESSNIKANI